MGRAAMLDQPLFVELAEKYGKTPGQVVLRWNIERGITPLPRSKDPVHIVENIDVFDFSLEKEDEERINALDIGLRIGPNPDTYPGGHEYFIVPMNHFGRYFGKGDITD